jgi:plasmid replication initiation protein
MQEEPFEVNTPETLGVTPRYVLQHNVISRSAHNLSATAKKLTAMAMALLPPDLSSLTASFTFTEFCNAIGYEKGGESFKLFLDGLKECVNNTISIELTSPKTGKKIWENYTWFTYSKYDEANGFATMTFSPQLAAVLLDLKRVYSKIMLGDLGELQGKYAVRFLELAISYSSLMGKDGNRDHQWYFERSVKELRFMLGVPESAYKETRLFRQRVIEGPVKELNKAGLGLSIKTTGVKQGRNLTSIRFDCQKVPRLIKQKSRPRKKTAPAPLELTELSSNETAVRESREEKEYQHLKELYPQEFAELYAEELSKPSFLPPESAFRQQAAETVVLAYLRGKYGIVK